MIKCYEDSNTSGEFSTWISKLELVAKLQNIDDKTAFVPLFLNGPAFALYEQLNDTVKKDYTKLKKELMTAFSMNCYSAYGLLRERVLEDGETVDVYLSDLKRLVSAIGQKQPGPLLKCAFMSGLPLEVANQLKATAAVEDMSLDDIVTRARTVISTKASSSLVCSGVQSTASASATNNIQCYTCSGQGHVARQCPTGRKGREPSRPVRCYSCQAYGHVSRNCNKRMGNDSGVASASDAHPSNTH